MTDEPFNAPDTPPPHPATSSGEISDAEAEPHFFPVSTAKLIVMSFCTLGIYQLYWFYKNFKIESERDRLASLIPPLFRTVLVPIFCYEIFFGVNKSAASLGIQTRFHLGLLTAAWIILWLAGRLPDPYWLVSFLSVFALVPVQKTVNDINSRLAPRHDPNNRFTKLNVTAIVAGGIIWLLVIAGTFIPE